MFVENCKKLEYKQLIGDVADVTALLDWSDEDLEVLSELSAHFSGVASHNEPVEITHTHYSLSRQSRTFMDDSLMKYSTKETICSTSWATSVIEVAEAALNNQFELSVDQLLHCLPVEYELESDCVGAEPKTIMSYLSEIGLVRKEDFTDCESLDNQARFKFEAVLPEAPNKSGLMNLVSEGKPVFVMMALNLYKLRYVKDMSEVEKPLICSFGQPTMYGIVSGYNSEIETPYWEIVSHLIPAEEMIVRVPMTANETNANYAAVAGYAFTLNWSNDQKSYTVDENEYPRIEDIPADATELVFKANSYPDVTALDLSRFVMLKRVEFGEYSFVNCRRVVVNNKLITSIVVGKGSFSALSGSGRRLFDLPSGFIINAPNLDSLVIGEGSMKNFEEIVIEESGENVSVEVGEGSLSNVETITTTEESREVGSNMKNAVEESNPGKVVELVIPTEEPTTQVPTQVPTTIPPTEEPTTIPPTEAPTTIPPTEEPTTIPPTASDLVISSEADCEKIKEKGWKSITVNEGLCNSMTDDLDISFYPYLEWIRVEDSLKNIHSLTISSKMIRNI